MKLNRTNTIAVAIDIQSKLLPFIHNSNELIDKTIRLINGLRALEIPIIVTEQYPRGLGSTDESIIRALDQDYQPIEKNTFSCCGNERFPKVLSQYGNSNILIFGIESHICVMQTVVDLLQKSILTPLVISDCISSRNPIDKKYGIKRMLKEGAFIGTMESVLMEITSSSKDAQFKTISNIIK